MQMRAGPARIQQARWVRWVNGDGGVCLVLRRLLMALFVALCIDTRVAAAAELERFLQGVQASAVFPGADRLADVDGSPPVAAAFRGDERMGFVFLNSDFVNATGYSGKPIHVLLAIDMGGVVRGARLVEHHEPIVLIGIPERRIAGVIDGFVGLDVAKLVGSDRDEHGLDIVSGATVTVMVIDDSVVRSAIKVARRYGLGGLEPEQALPSGPKPVIDRDKPATSVDWIELVGDGSVRRLKLTVADVNRAFEEAGDIAAAERPEPGDPDEIFIELYVALVTIPTVGRSTLGDGEYRNLSKRLGEDRHAILIAADGRYSFKGSGYVRGGIFDRFQLIQGDTSIRFRDRDHKRLRTVAADGAPSMGEVDLFYIPKEAEFDAGLPWRLQLLVSRAIGPTSKAFTTFELVYHPPEKYLEFEPVAPVAESTGPAPWAQAPVAIEALR